jgi:uncharacterized protein YgiM (DUF1202 family)
MPIRMKKRVLVVLLVLCAGAAFAASMKVQVRKAKVRSKPARLGRVLKTVTYGQAVEVGLPKRGWYPVVLADDKQGWLHQSVLSKRSVKLRADTTDANVNVSSDEVALAGKGFDEKAEAKLKEKTALDYTWVDRMASFQVSDDQVRAFLAEGQLAGGEL